MGEQLRRRVKIWCCGIIALSLVGCSSSKIPPPHVVLSESQTVDLIRHPKKWHRQIVTLKLYPFDVGGGERNGEWSYLVCFEPCDRAVANRSTFMVRTGEDRFKGFAGATPVVVRARYDACNVEWPCSDLWSGVFVVVE